MTLGFRGQTILAAGATLANGVRPPPGFVFIRTVPGTQMRNPPDIYVIGPVLNSGVAA